MSEHDLRLSLGGTVPPGCTTSSEDVRTQVAGP